MPMRTAWWVETHETLLGRGLRTASRLGMARCHVCGRPRLCLPLPRCCPVLAAALYAREPRDPDVTHGNVLTQMPAGGRGAVAPLLGVGAGGSANPLSGRRGLGAEGAGEP